MAIIQTPDERHYAQVTHPRAQAVPNSAGAATLAGADSVRHIRARLSAVDNIIRSAGKTGSRGLLAAIKGRKGASFDCEYPLAGSGAAGTHSDLQPVIEAMMGQAGTASAGVSVTYTLANSIPGLTLWNFRDPAGSNIWNECLWGGVVNSFEIAAGAESEATIRIGGDGAYVVNKPNFAALTTPSKGGLTSFPTEPTAVYLGTPAVAFVGSITINGVSTFLLESFKVRGALNRQIRSPFGSYYPSVEAAGIREFTADIAIYEENTSAQAALRHLVFTKGVFDATLVIGEDPGNIWTIALKNLIAPSSERQDGGLESIINLNGCVASKSSISANDELTIVCT